MSASQKSNDLTTFGKRLRFFRKQRRISQEDLAAKINTVRQNVSAWETDKRQNYGPYLDDICSVLGVDAIKLETGISTENQTVANDLGLSDFAIATLKDWTKNREIFENHAARINIDESKTGEAETANIAVLESLEVLNLLLETHNGWRLLSLIYRFCYADFDHPSLEGQRINAIDFPNRSSAIEGITKVNTSLLRFATLKAIETELEDLRNNLIEMEDQTK